ncbi:ABC transporter permease [Elstera cyanobacteriorum]|uniref:EamA family transporter n=1 Tax=Elstera cyanobacteriorum TaxID=2022747 RepID=A0A255XR41_9PROT|nr:EamA family transporter [Elstera cyanobacteriorum]OYQ19372.1 EamA family transporter [Elstera cyanobacteriorum]GFZ90940.1 ABC transporter permease [Elstera cyanobacteriorum]
MAERADLALTALAPAIWGSTYLVTTELPPPGYPLTLSLLRALPAGLLLLLLVRQLPTGLWWNRVFLLGALNFSIFWALLFVAAYRLPGGVAATVGAVQPLIVVGLERLFFNAPIRRVSVIVGLAGIAGVALLVLTPKAGLDPIGVAAGLGGAVSMACGTVLTRYWRPPVSALTVTAWQLTAGGLLLLPVALLLEPSLPMPSLKNLAGFAYLGLIGAALTYILWFRGIGTLRPSLVAPLGFLSPLMAVLLGWGVLGQSLTPAQLGGVAIVLGSVWLNQRAAQKA